MNFIYDELSFLFGERGCAIKHFTVLILSWSVKQAYWTMLASFTNILLAFNSTKMRNALAILPLTSNYEFKKVLLHWPES